MPDGSVRVAGLATQAALAGTIHRRSRALRRGRAGPRRARLWPHRPLARSATTGPSPHRACSAGFRAPPRSRSGCPRTWTRSAIRRPRRASARPARPTMPPRSPMGWCTAGRRAPATRETPSRGRLRFRSGVRRRLRSAGAHRSREHGSREHGPQDARVRRRRSGRGDVEAAGRGRRRPAHPVARDDRRTRRRSRLRSNPRRPPRRAAYDESDVEQTHPRSAVAGAATAAAAAGGGDGGCRQGRRGAVGSAAGAVRSQDRGVRQRPRPGARGQCLTDRRTLKRAQRGTSRPVRVSIDQAPADTGLEPRAAALAMRPVRRRRPFSAVSSSALFAALVFVARVWEPWARPGSARTPGSRSILGDTAPTGRRRTHRPRRPLLATAPAGHPSRSPALTVSILRVTAARTTRWRAKVFDEDPASYWH